MTRISKGDAEALRDCSRASSPNRELLADAVRAPDLRHIARIIAGRTYVAINGR